jgi:outer membrane receptor protein involved in Fe transport
VVRPLTLGLNAGYLNAKYKQFGNSNPAVLETFNFSHQTMLFSPKWQMGFNADLDQPLNDKLRLVGSLLTSYISKTTAGLSSVPGVPNNIIPAYWLTNLRLGVKTTDDRVGVYMVVTNLFDKGYFTYGSTGGTGNNLMWGDPRIISGEVQIKF